MRKGQDDRTDTDHMGNIDCNNVRSAEKKMRAILLIACIIMIIYANLAYTGMEDKDVFKK